METRKRDDEDEGHESQCELDMHVPERVVYAIIEVRCCHAESMKIFKIFTKNSDKPTNSTQLLKNILPRLM